MRTIEAGIGHPDDDLLSGQGNRPDSPSTSSRSAETYHSEYFWAGDPTAKPGLQVVVEVLDEATRAARVIAANKGPKPASEYQHGEIIIIPPGTRLISQGYVKRRRDKNTR